MVINMDGERNKPEDIVAKLPDWIREAEYEEEALDAWAKPILDMLNRVRGVIDDMNGADAREALCRVMGCLKVSLITEPGLVGVGKFKIEPVDRRSIEELPIEVREAIGLEAVLTQGVLGLTTGLDRTGMKVTIIDDMASRLHILSDLWNSESLIATPKVKEAAKMGFLIVAKQWLEDAFAEERPFLSGGGCRTISESERVELFNRRLNQAIEISKRWVGPLVHEQVVETVPVSVGMVRPIFGVVTSPEGEPKVTELTHTLCSLAEEIRCTRRALSAKGGLTVDAPAFEKRPVPTQEVISGRSQRPVKR
jgi:hypothetical protein